MHTLMLNIQSNHPRLHFMKPQLRHRHILAIASLLLASPAASMAQTSAGGGAGAQPTGTAANMVIVQGGVAADTTYGGTISTFSADGFSLLAAPNGTATNFMMGPNTVFLDSEGRIIPREQFNAQMPATVTYVRSGNQLIATRVVAQPAAPATPAPFSAGSLTEVSPGILVVKVAGASSTPVQYVNNQTTNYVDQQGNPVAPSSVKPGTPVRVFYTKVGDTLIASKVEVQPATGTGLPIPAVIEATPTSTTTTTIERKVKP